MLNSNTRSFQLQKFISMEPTYPPQSTLSAKPPRSTSFGSRRSVCEYPTSPQFFLGEKIMHASHPQHQYLSEMDSPDLFTCAGCKEYGAGKRFSCQQCDFQLHHFCALAPKSLMGHPLHCHHKLLFQTKPASKGGILNSKCDACSKPIKGYNFRCSACSFQMHPCCANLSTEMNFPVHQHTLKLLPVTPSTNGDSPDFVCGECRRKRSGKVYRCRVSACNYHLHLVCAKNMVNGLEENNIKGKEKTGMFGTAARVASQVIIDFIGGLIEGLGEGVGEVLVQNMTKARNNNTNKQIKSDGSDM